MRLMPQSVAAISQNAIDPHALIPPLSTTAQPLTSAVDLLSLPATTQLQAIPERDTTMDAQNDTRSSSDGSYRRRSPLSKTKNHDHVNYI